MSKSLRMIRLATLPSRPSIGASVLTGHVAARPLRTRAANATLRAAVAAFVLLAIAQLFWRQIREFEKTFGKEIEKHVPSGGTV
jgi:predicted acyltransferase